MTSELQFRTLIMCERLTRISNEMEATFEEYIILREALGLTGPPPVTSYAAMVAELRETVASTK